jgi:Ni/Co efflux regulator RcnB
MKSTAIVCAIAAATLGFGSLSFAQGYDRRGQGNDAQRYDQRGPDRDGRNFNNRDARNDRDNNRRFELRQGAYVPQEYRQRQYVVDDWRGHRLSAPPRGQQWVQIGADYALIAIGTGLIANILINGSGYGYGYAKDARGAVADPGM